MLGQLCSVFLIGQLEIQLFVIGQLYSVFLIGQLEYSECLISLNTVCDWLA